MWGTVLLLALQPATDPVRLGIVVFLMSRPRPISNLLAFWLGGMTSSITVAVGMLLLLRDFGLMVVHAVSSATGGSTARHIQLACGVLALAIAAVIAAGLPARQRARVPISGGNRSAPVLQPSSPTAFSRVSARVKDRLQGGSLGVSFVLGIGLPPNVWVALAAIAASRAAIGTQLSAALMYTLVQLAVVEVPLLTYLAAPVRTEAVMQQLHNWVRAHGREILVFVLAVAGVFLVANGV